MRFKLFANAFLNLPTVIDDGDTRYTKTLATSVTHEDGSPITMSNPRVVDFPSDLPLNSISRRWEAMDDEAKEAQGKLPKATSNLAGLDTKFEPPAPVVNDAASVLAALGSLSDEEKSKLFAVLGGKTIAPIATKPAPVDPKAK
ncbi:MAG: hypothetical protein RIQ79_2407 [Verrucomicrobiota bacterium]